VIHQFRIVFNLIVFVKFVFIIPSIAFTQSAEEKFELTSIEFEGNEYASSSLLKSIIVSKESPAWFWKFLYSFTRLGKEPIYIDSSLIQTDLKILKSFYNDNGFFLAEIESSYDLDTVNFNARLKYHIREKIRSKIVSYEYKGLRKENIGEWLLQKIIDGKTVKIYEPFSRENIESDIYRVLDELKSFGFMLAERGNAVVTIDTISNSVNIETYFTPGKYFKISNVAVEKRGAGKDLIDDELLIDLVDIVPGERYNNTKISEAQLRLYRTELFSSALINSVISDTVNGTVPLNISVDIGKINELGPEILLNNQSSTFNVGLGLNYTRKNLFGGARKFTIRTEVLSQDILNVNYKNVFGRDGLKDTSVIGGALIVAGVEQPYILSTSISGKLEFFGAVEQQKFYRYYTLGTKLGLTFESPQYVFFNNYKTFLSYESVDVDVRASLPREIILGLLTSLNYPIPNNYRFDELLKEFQSALHQSNSIIGIDLFSNHANDLFSPTKGYNLQLSLEYAGLLPYLKNLFGTIKDENIQYYKINLIGSVYTNPWKPSIGGLAYKIRLGYMHKFDGMKSIPRNRLFHSGGSNSIRGWRARGLGPTITYMNNIGQLSTIDELGGLFIFEGSIESRNRIIGDVGTVLFVDFGNTWENIKLPRINDIAVAIGTGIRYYSSFAPFRLDFGVQFYDPHSQKFIFERSFFRGFQIHFGIGEAF
jgi:outer membrane protein assembly factor BamA